MSGSGSECSIAIGSEVEKKQDRTLRIAPVEQFSKPACQKAQPSLGQAGGQTAGHTEVAWQEHNVCWSLSTGNRCAKI